MELTLWPRYTRLRGAMSETRQVPTSKGEDADILQLYLAEVARIPPLSEEEEQELARRMRAGDRLSLIHI